MPMRLTTSAFAAVLLLASAATAVTTQIHEDATADAFLEGAPDGVVVTRAGRLEPGAFLTRIEVAPAGVWSLAFGGRGDLFAGTGNDGRILRRRDGRVTVVYETGSVLVPALARGPDGEVFAGTVPDGAIYRIDSLARELTVRLLARLPDPNVWAIDVDALGRVYAGTGPNGNLYRVTADGAVEKIFTTGDRDVLSVHVDGRGGVYAGTGGKGLLLHVQPTESGHRATVLHDFDEDEVRSLAVVRGTLYAGVNRDLGGGQAKQVTAIVKSVSAIAAAGRRDPVEAEDEIGAKPGAAEPAGKALLAGAIYRVDPEGGAEKVLSFPDNGVADVRGDTGGGLVIAAGRGGRVFRWTEADGATLVHRLASEHVGALAMLEGRLAAIGAANGGSIHGVETGADRAPRYVSSPLDARFTSRWGVLAVESQVRGLVVETRSGNTTTPDALWSEWAPLRAPRAEAGEAAESALRVASPAARFLQYRLTWPAGATGAVRRVTIAYLPRNQPPRLSALTVDGAGGDGGGPKANGGGAAPANGGGGSGDGEPVVVRQIAWKVDPVDGDPIEYHLSYRGLDESAWKPLPAGGLKGTTYAWDTASVPDGIYLVRVIASDAPGNGDGGLEATATTDPILVDNRKPVVEITSIEPAERGGVVRGRAEDGFSRIAAIEMQIDGGPWRPIAPTDGLLDQTVESFVAKLPDTLTEGAHSIAIRVRDAAGNLGVTARTVEW